MESQISPPLAALAQRPAIAPGQRIWWRAPVRLDGRVSGNVSATLGKSWRPYDVREDYFCAHRKHNPLLAPHGLFRDLRYGRAADARKFLETFGPLTLTPSPSALPPHGRYSFALDIFWSRQLRYRLVADLWENRNEKDALQRAWRAMAEKHKGASLLKETPLGFEEKPAPHSRAGATPPPPGLSADSPPFPWNLAGLPFEKWAREVEFAEAKKQALALVRQELNLHSKDCAIRWEGGPQNSWEPTGEKFRPVIQAPSLLSMIWELFGLDTAGVAWRRCPHCQKLFYPKRRDQFYCTPRQQALASKRAYAARRRAAERKSRRTSRARRT